MKQTFPLFLSIFLFALAAVATSTTPAEVISLRKQNFNSGWKFQFGEQPQALDADFDHNTWKSVKLPHDWSIAGPIEKDNPSGRHGGYYPTGIGVYRKAFNFKHSWRDKQVSITFDGVMCNSDVWVNGHHLGHRPNGYVGFNYDLTPHLKRGENIIVVKADNSLQPNSRWYTGCGIYRNVWLHVKNKTAIAHNGTYVVAKEIQKDTATIEIETTLDSGGKTDGELKFLSEIYSPEGKKVAESSASVEAKTTIQNIKINHPALWSVEYPEQYKLVTKLVRGNELLDQCETLFGIRDIRFEIETGFWLNGENIKIKGVNNHHDGGPVGAAVPEDVLYRRLLILKEMGCNAIRTAHNPAAPEFYEMCDRMGFLVMDEIFDEWIASWPWVDYQNRGKIDYGYHLYFEEWAQKDLKDIILRDRNHPSIILWSVGNEIPDQCYPEGPERLKPIMETVRKLDPTREITCGCCFIHLANATGFSSMLDVTGYNGGGGSVFYEKDKATYPNRKFIATEIPHSFQTRGIYKTHTEMRSPHQGIEVPNLTEKEVFPEVSEFYNSSYDNSSVRIGARDSWRRTRDLPYVAGEFRWTGFDYLGEAIRGWPARFHNFGIIDLCGFPKDHYYFYKSQWTEEPMVHLLPHWTHPGKEGVTIPVWTYSNAEEVELFQNGKSLGAKSNIDQMHLSWDVEYQPGTLKAIARSNGKMVAESVVTTASDPAKIEIIADKTTIPADGTSCIHLEFNILDETSNFVPNANNLLHFKISGPVQNIGVENGDPLDLSNAKVNFRKAFNGKCLMILQSKLEPGKILIEASSDSLPTQNIQLEVVSP